MRLPGFTADASLRPVRYVYGSLTAGDALDRTGAHEARSIVPAVDCQSLGMCCARTRDPRSACCMDYARFCS